MKIRTLGRLVGLGLVLLMAAAGTATAQIFPGRVSGSVQDPQGAAVPGAEVKLSAPSIGFERKAITDDSGYFNFPELPLGQFELTVSKAGFKTEVQTNIVTSFGKVNEVNVTLEVGNVVSRVEVTAAAPLVQTETNSTGAVLETTSVTELPTGNRDFTRLALIMPGTSTNTNFTFSQYVLNGSPARSALFNIDGAANTDTYRKLPSINQGGNSATAASRLPLDAIQEVSVEANAAADVEGGAGGLTNVVLKSGTNTFHGTLYEFHRDRGLNAANFFENLAGTPKGGFVWNEFGMTAGGPLIIPGLYDGRNRTFLFGAYDGSTNRIGTIFSSRAPTDAQVQQALALLQAAQPGFQPNSISLEILKLYQPFSGPFVASNSGSQRPNSGLMKVDHRISDSDTLSGRYLIGDGIDRFPQGNSGPGGGSQLERFFGVTPIRAQNVALSEVHIFSPTLLSTVRLGWNRSHLGFFSADSSFDPMSIGLNTGVSPENFGLPEIDVGSPSGGRFANLGINPSFPRERTTETYQVSGDLSYTRGAHRWKTGMQWFRNKSYGFNNNGVRGLITFDGTQLGNTLTSDGSIASLIDLLAGLPTPGKTTISRGSTRFDVHQNVIGAYIMDTFQVTRNFTFVYGLRWDFFTVPQEERDRFSNFIPGIGLVQQPQLNEGRIFENVLTNYQPRVAIAYSPFSLLGRQTVIRAGYGIYDESPPFDVFVGQTFNIANSNPGLATNPIGNAGIFTVTPSGPIPFGPGVPIFGPPVPTPPFNLIGVDPHLRTQQAQEWNFNIQQELARDIVFQVGYVGTKGTHLLNLLDLNQPTPGDPATAAQRRPLAMQFPEFGKVDIIRSFGNSTYNSLQLTLRSRNYHGLTTLISYTWSHFISEGDETLDFFGTSGFVPQDSRNLGANRSDSEFDVRNAAIFNYVYEFPTFSNRGKWARLVNGWQLSGTTTFRDGLASPVLTFGNESGTNTFHDRPNCVGRFVTQDSDLTKEFVVSGFAEPAPGTFGNCPRNAFVGPGLAVWNIAVTKNTPINDRMGVQLRVDFFNAFNRPNFGAPIPVLGATFIPGTIDEAGFDSRFGNGGPRNIQLNAKFTW